jgi:hypothetical protein
MSEEEKMTEPTDRGAPRTRLDRMLFARGVPVMSREICDAVDAVEDAAREEGRQEERKRQKQFVGWWAAFVEKPIDEVIIKLAEDKRISIRNAISLGHSVALVAISAKVMEACEEGRKEEREPIVSAPGFHEIAAAARVLCREMCAAYPCRECSPSSRTWDLAVDVLRAAGVLRTPEQVDHA